jgi:chromosome segregation protein
VRLTQIKLAGFKSFVDPTHVDVPGQLVGVVGPNGCGKSNIIDAVRWVLGESRASALRGDSMQDVIFNGSSLRKPVARASVELVFDNSLGKAAGQWSQYGEISVKRMLTRDGDSSYWINNTAVRRKDIHDVFLGTGLGPRAYAIIEQGMISRIIEAKPEELRVFLEEAAGVSKYKERRKETEHRLADTRENLSRVNDICGELGGQIEKLEKQAEVARRFNDLSAERDQKQRLLWLLRRNEAAAEADKHARDFERMQNELEAQTARLREIELHLEQAREEHYGAGDFLNAAQGELYQANSEVARLESEIRYVSETRQRIESQLGQLRGQRELGQVQEAQLKEAAGMWQDRLRLTSERLGEMDARLAEEQERMPEADKAFRSGQTRLAEEKERIAQAEQALRVEQAHIAHLSKALQALESREERLLAERQELSAPETEALAQLAEALEADAEELERQESMRVEVESGRAALQANRQAAAARVQTLEKELSTLDGTLLTLQRIQSQVEDNGQIHDWIEQHQLAGKPRLWQKIRVEQGWESAVESALRERLHAMELSDGDLLERLIQNPPPAKMSVFTLGEHMIEGGEPELTPLAQYVQPLDREVQSAVSAWLAAYYAVEGVPSLAVRTALPPHVVLVNREGHQFSRYGVHFHAADAADTGILARQREIEGLTLEAETRQQEIGNAGDELAQCERLLEEHNERLSRLRAESSALKQRNHERQLEHLKLAKTLERFQERSGQIERELAEIAANKAQEQSDQAAAEGALETHQQTIEGLYEQFEQAKQEHQAAERRLEEQRRALQQSERELQETTFAEKECANKISEIERSLSSLVAQTEAAIENIERLETEVGGLQDQGMRDRLQEALELRVAKEEALSDARSRLEEIAGQLREFEEARLQCEQTLQPLRDRIADLKLKEQAARINAEQFAQQLIEFGADEEALMAELKDGQKAAPLQGEITRLNNAIAELGAINMAALDELATNQERKQFLDAQVADLNAALETLESAIRKIDRETRDLLQTTYDTVNIKFAETFPALFGGGEAKLVMTGDEILNCGVQVVARPPGKKNSTIHLLSGGEKALTAISLVFSFFHLNPAPFCLLDEVDAPLDDANTVRFCELVKKMSQHTQFLYISHNKLTMEMANQLVGVTMQEQGCSRVVAVDMDEALKIREEVAA